MTAVPGVWFHNEAVTAAASPRGAAGTNQAWQREMERAQAQQWFHPATPAPQAVAADGAARRLAGGAAGEQDATVRPGVAAAAPVAARVSRASGPLLTPELASTLQPVPWNGAPPMRTQPVGAGGAVSALACPTPTPTPTSTRAPQLAKGALQPAPAAAAKSLPFDAMSSSAAVRLHVEESPEGLRIWVGLDTAAGDLPARIQAVLSELRREAAARGQRLALVVCNGEALLQQDAEHLGGPSDPRSFQPHQEP